MHENDQTPARGEAEGTITRIPTTPLSNYDTLQPRVIEEHPNYGRAQPLYKGIEDQ